MNLSEAEKNKVYEVTGLYQITDEGRKVFTEKGIITGAMIHIKELTSYNYLLCSILTTNNKEIRVGISIEDAI